MVRIGNVYIYHCYGGSHSSVTAAAIHVGLLKDEIPTTQVLMSLPYYDTQQSLDHGVLQYVGRDENDNLVFSVGLETVAQPVIDAIRNLFSIAKVDIGHVKFVDTLSTVNGLMKLGGVTSRALGLKTLGRPMVLRGTQKAYKDIRQLVMKIKSENGDVT